MTTFDLLDMHTPIKLKMPTYTKDEMAVQLNTGTKREDPRFDYKAIVARYMQYEYMQLVRHFVSTHASNLKNKTVSLECARALQYVLDLKYPGQV